MSLFWPTRRNEAAGAAARFGRVLHWGAFVVALILPTVVAFFSLQGDVPNGAGWTVTVLWFLAWALVGRGLRYVLAGE